MPGKYDFWMSKLGEYVSKAIVTIFVIIAIMAAFVVVPVALGFFAARLWMLVNIGWNLAAL